MSELGVEMTLQTIDFVETEKHATCLHRYISVVALKWVSEIAVSDVGHAFCDHYSAIR